MSAGVQPEGFENYMLDVRAASIHTLQMLNEEYDQKVIIPALIMALTSIVRMHVGEGRFENMEHGMNIVHEGLYALSDDVKRDMEGLDNGN